MLGLWQIESVGEFQNENMKKVKNLKHNKNDIYC